MTRIPDYEQAMEALEEANRVRRARADLKKEIKQYPYALCRVFRNPPEYALGQPVGPLLMAINRWGKTQVRKVLESERVGWNRSIESLTTRQREALALAVENVERRRDHGRRKKVLA